MTMLASDWLRHFRLLLWNLLNGIQRNLIGSKILRTSTKFVFFGPIGKTRWPPWLLIGWDIFDFFPETAEQDSMKLHRMQDLNVLYQVFVFRANRKIKMATLASDWLWHFQLLLWNYQMEFNKTWQEARSQRPLPSLCFSGLSVNKNGHPGRFLKKVAHCTQVHDMWPFGPLVVKPCKQNIDLAASARTVGLYTLMTRQNYFFSRSGVKSQAHTQDTVVKPCKQYRLFWSGSKVKVSC